MKKQNIIIWQENLVASEMQIFISFEKAANIFVKWQQVKTKKYDVTNTSGIVQVSCNVLKSLQNKKGLKIFQLPTFWCLFLSCQL